MFVMHGYSIKFGLLDFVKLRGELEWSWVFGKLVILDWLGGNRRV